jgi:hypothetical protein
VAVAGQWRPFTVAVAADYCGYSNHLLWQRRPFTVVMAASNDGHLPQQWQPAMAAIYHGNGSHLPRQWQLLTTVMVAILAAFFVPLVGLMCYSQAL